jgi:hypothetical protein
MGYGQIIATALQTGNVQPVTAMPGDIAHNLNNVVATLTNTSITPVLDVSLLPSSVTLNNVIELPVVLGVDLLAPPAATLDAASFSAATFATAVQAGNPRPRSPRSSTHPRSWPTASSTARRRSPTR